MNTALFERRHRQAARLALYSSLTLVGALLAGCLYYLARLRPPAEDFSYLRVDWPSIPAVRLLQRYLQIDTAQPDANEVAGAEFLASVLAEHGIPSTLERLGDGHANLWAVLEGASPEAVVLHNHIDTDPVADPGEWSYPPFSGAIAPPFIFGRGAYDMKGIAIAQLQTLLDLKASGKRLRRSLIFLATGTEEVGSALGTKWVLAQHPELSRRFWAFLTEGGVVEARGLEDPQIWEIEVAQKRFVDVVLCASQRELLDAVRQDLVEERKRGGYEVKITPELAAFLAPYAPTRKKDLFRQVLADPRSLLLDGPTWAGLPPYLKSLVRNEAHPFHVEADPAGGYRMLVKIHLLPGEEVEPALARLLPEGLTHGLSRTVRDEGGAKHGSPVGHEAFVALRDALQAAYPQVPVGPYFLPATATDARFVRAAGIPAYGFSPFLLITPETARIGRIDERLHLPGYVKGVEIYARAVERLVADKDWQPVAKN